MALGYTPMDDIHEEFDELLAQASTSGDSDLAERLCALHAHLQNHFSQENHWMAETDFPARECHIAEHEAVLASVEQVMVKIEEGNLDIGRSLVQALASWFPMHAIHLDSALAQWMCKRRTGGIPIVLHPRRPGSVTSRTALPGMPTARSAS
ncbi:cation-binding hemerythrin HHE family protein [compost metagenome]